MGNPMQLQNEQAIEPRSFKADGDLDVVDIWRTIQGEAIYAGHPAVFVRLAGCNLQCPLCDTDYTSNRKTLTPDELLDKVMLVRDREELVVITGGEPFRQNIRPFVARLVKNMFKVQIETNGSLPPENFPVGFVQTVISPKGKVHPDWEWKPIGAYKYVVAYGEVDDDGFPISVLGNEFSPGRPLEHHHAGGVPVYIQPRDDKDELKNLKNLETAINVCRKFNRILCLQLHKIIGLE